MVNEKVEFEVRQLWAAVRMFKGWDYSLMWPPHPDPEKAKICQSPGPTIPMDILRSIRRGSDSKILESSWPSETLIARVFEPLAYGRQTNCSSFTSAVLLGAAVRMAEEGGPHWVFRPEWQMWANSNWGEWANRPKPWAGTETLPRSYQDRPEIAAWLCANFATSVSREAPPEPGAWYICSIGSHSFFIIDYSPDANGDPGRGKCLTLESNSFGKFGENFNRGFVGHRGLWSGRKGFPIGDGPPADWARLVEPSGITWGEISNWKDFICARINLKSAAPKFVCPLDGEDASPNLWKHYANNETSTRGVGGYYAVGLQRNFHGGIHLFPDKGATDTPVRALAPGHVVAARLPPMEMLDKERIAHLGNWPGFVLVRHELIELDDKHADKGQPAPFYSLSMHVRSPVYGQQAPGQPVSLAQNDRYFTDVKWFRSLVERRFGAFVRVIDDPAVGLTPRLGATPTVKLGELVWAATKVEVDENGAVKGKRFPVTHPGISEITVKENGTVAWLYKPSPAKLVEAVEALATGKVVTFTDRFFPVAGGETVGLLSPLPASLQAPTTIARRPFESGFLHWQVFAPADGPGESGIALLERLASKVQLSAERAKAEGLEKADGMKFSEVVDEHDDAFIDPDDLKSSLCEALPEADRKKFEEGFPALSPELGLGQYASNVIEFLDTSTSFAPKQTGRRAWEAGCTPSYPMVLQLDAPHLMSPEKNAQALTAAPVGVDPPPNGKHYLVELTFLTRVGGVLKPLPPQRGCEESKCCQDRSHARCQPRPLAIDADLFRAARGSADQPFLNLALVVPAEADVLRVTLRGGLLAEAGSQVQGSEVLLLRDAAKERWRGSRLRHLIEWSPEYFKKVAKALEKLSIRVSIADELDELAWCDPEKEVPIGRLIYKGASGGFVPGSSTEPAKLFGPHGLVPAGKVDNLHPVTATWLLNVVDRLQLARLNEGGQAPSFGQADGQPLCAGWVMEGPPKLGGVVHAVVVDDDYDADDAACVEITAKQGKKTLHLAADKPDANGVLVREIATDFWGDWTIETGPKAAKRIDLFGPEKLSIPVPEALAFSDEELAMGLDQLHRLPDGTLQLVVKVKEPVSRLEGCLRFEVCSGPGPFTPGTEGLAVAAVALAPAKLVGTAAGGSARPIPFERAKLEFSADEKVIVGLATDARGKPYVDAKLADGLSFGDFKNVSTQFRLACVLLDVLVAGAKAGGLVVEHVTPDGLELRVLPAKKDAAKVLAALQSGSALVAIVPEGDAAGHLTLTATKATLVALDRCERLAPNEAMLECDAQHHYVVDLKGAVGGITPAALRTAYYAKKPSRLNLSVMLLEALTLLRTEIKHISPTFLGIDGYTCRIKESGDAVLKAARETRRFVVVEPWPSGGTLLMVCPDPERTLVARFHPSSVLRQLAEGLNLGPGEPMRYRARLVIPNGFHYLRARSEALPHITAPDDQAPLTAIQGVVDSAEFDQLIERAAGKLEFPPSQERVFRLIALSKPTLTWTTRSRKPVVEVGTRLLGATEAWSGFKLKVSVDLGSGFNPVKDFEAVKAESLTAGQLTLRIPVTQSLTQKMTVKVEPMAPPWTDESPPAVEQTEDYEPKWTDSALIVSSDKSKKRVELRCGTSGVARAEKAGTQSYLTDPNTIPEFQLTVERVGSPPAPTPAKQPKLPTHRYQVPTRRGFGSVDEDGAFLAFLDERDLEPGVVYRFELKLCAQYDGREKGRLADRTGTYPRADAVPGDVP